MRLPLRSEQETRLFHTYSLYFLLILYSFNLLLSHIKPNYSLINGHKIVLQHQHNEL